MEVEQEIEQEIEQGVEREIEQEAKQAAANYNYSAQNLAYMGDAVFELYVRQMLLQKGSQPVDALNRQARGYVSAKAQAVMYNQILPLLTDEETSILKRGRNLHSTSKAKSAGTLEYRHATGLETLFGYLFVKDRHQRLREIFDKCTEAKNETANNNTKKEMKLITETVTETKTETTNG